jgi:hypothetical protein
MRRIHAIEGVCSDHLQVTVAWILWRWASLNTTPKQTVTGFEFWLVHRFFQMHSSFFTGRHDLKYEFKRTLGMILEVFESPDCISSIEEILLKELSNWECIGVPE